MFLIWRCALAQFLFRVSQEIVAMPAHRWLFKRSEVSVYVDSLDPEAVACRTLVNRRRKYWSGLPFQSLTSSETNSHGREEDVKTLFSKEAHCPPFRVRETRKTVNYPARSISRQQPKQILFLLSLSENKQAKICTKQQSLLSPRTEIYKTFKHHFSSLAPTTELNSE